MYYLYIYIYIYTYIYIIHIYPLASATRRPGRGASTSAGGRLPWLRTNGVNTNGATAKAIGVPNIEFQNKLESSGNILFKKRSCMSFSDRRVRVLAVPRVEVEVEVADFRPGGGVVHLIGYVIYIYIYIYRERERE